MPAICDGPTTPRFAPVAISGNVKLSELPASLVSPHMIEGIAHAPAGKCTAWGLPFHVRSKAILVAGKPVTRKIKPLKAGWLVFLHASDLYATDLDRSGFAEKPWRGSARLNEHAANYVLLYADGTEAPLEIRRRHQIGPFQRGWGENCFQAVGQAKPHPVAAGHEQATAGWGQSQTRVTSGDMGWWVNWLWAAENPHPRKRIVGIRFEPVNGAVLVSGVSAGDAQSNPLRWQSRRKALLTLPASCKWDPTLDDRGRLSQLQLDMGQVVSARPRPKYPNSGWARTYNNALPEVSAHELIVEYTAHPDAVFQFACGTKIPVAALDKPRGRAPLKPIAPTTQRVTVRVVEKGSKAPVAVKLHVHGQAGEYLAPVDRHRIPNPAWFEDYTVDFVHAGIHECTYIPGETCMDLPLGKVYIEVSKGFEIKPVRKTVTVTRATKQIVLEIRRQLPWRKAGWVSADTHVHFLSPPSAMLEGAAEGVNVVNLLASQWGELMTNVGDFDGKTTFGSREAGGDGEYLVRVGTENRQHVMGHISLLGYGGQIIAPMTTGGADESAIGDPVEVLLTEWARQCNRQDGLVIIPHFPNPRAEHAATIVDGQAAGIEMTSWGNLYAGIDAYSLSDWYRYLNCGYFVAAVGGTDKMSATTPVGAIRTYAKVGRNRAFTYEAWMQAVRDGRTFVTYGPLMEFAVEGKPSGSCVVMKSSGGTVDVAWKVASVTVPMTKVELVVNGEIRESRSVRAGEAKGSWSVKVDRSSWLALLVRGRYKDKPEIIAAHSSPVMVTVKGTEFFAAADAMTILDQIEGAIAYLDTVGTRAETAAWKRMRLTLTGVHRKLHNRMHAAGVFHDHTPTTDHPEHH